MTGDSDIIEPRELAQLLEGGNSPTLIDVREQWEWEIGRIQGARLIPLATIPGAVAAIDPSADVVVYCHHGMRSDMAARFLRKAGVARVRNLVGGIDRWSDEVDPGVPRY